DDKLLNEYLDKADIEEESIKKAINDRKLFPCYFGSALKNEGVNELLDGIERYAKEPDYGKDLALRVYKISFAQGIRLTHIKLLGGKIKVKDVLPNGDKIDQIRIYQGNRFTTINEADPGSVCVLKGPTLLRTFDTIGIDQDIKTIFNPYTSYTLQFDPGIDSFKLYKDLKGLEAEYPEIHFEYKEASRDISVSSMGEIQNQILAGIIKQRFNIDVTFGSFKIDYRETITRKVEGVGHFEPLRHYAEVHLLLEPLKRGSGIAIDTICPLDLLSSQYQNQVLNILQESNLRGVLTNSPLTDIKITLVSGRAHIKHTEGGDFKEATFRALRQGLLNAGSILLEAMLSFTLEIPSNYLSTAIYDLDQLKAQYQISYQDDRAIITGKGPAQGLNNYQSKALNYSKGEAVYQAIFAGYEEMEDSDKVIEDIAYDPLNDPENPAFSVFTHNGRSEIIAYDEVFNYMHLDSFKEEAVSDISTYKPVKISDKELEAVMNRIAKKKEPYKEPEKKVRPVKESKPEQVKPVVHKPKLLIVDGYNMINGFTAFKNDAKSDYNFARNNFIDLMANYAGYYGSKIILVFDAYRAPNKTSHSETYGNLEVVYTRYQQDADSYIEKFIHDNRDKYQISVATSDRMIQNAALSSGARRISARELEAIIEKTVNE
ncbi:MAG: NYN domain-containing protein, partial [Erysipelotrichaceae bacterium]|nr:NYN domain-containing protein [Erysipelotrichaceae bacterium]